MTPLKQLKKELRELKRAYKNFWYYHNLDKEMLEILGCDPMAMGGDEEGKRLYKAMGERIERIEGLLALGELPREVVEKIGDGRWGEI